MSGKKILIILLILLFILMPVSLASDGDFTIPSVIKDITVKDDGSTVITEEIVYDIEGSVNGVYREIPLSDGQAVRNISVKTPGYYNKLDIIRNNGSTLIKVWLYTDAAKTQKTKDAKVAVTYKYTIRKGVKIYNDIVDFQYMTWGNNWNTGVDHMESTIHIPGSKNNTELWNNPEDNVVSSQWTSDDTLTTKLDNIGAHTSFEQRILMPTSYFKNTTFAQVIDMDAKELIEADQRKYQEERNTQGTITSISWIILAIMALISFGIYGLYGREPKIDYDAEYEYDFPIDASILQVNSLMDGEIGHFTENAKYATILDLIERKYFKVVVNDAESTIIRQTDKDTSNLKEHEKSMIDFLTSFAEDGDISIGYIGKRSHHAQFVDFSHTWEKQAKQEASDTWLKQYFDNKGSKLLLYLAVLYGILFVVVMILFEFEILPSYLGMVALAAFALFMFGGVIMFVMPYRVAGRWTPEGREVHEKWKNFEKYIKDYSLIEERPPASVQVWGKYLVYASALGCADTVSKNMKQYFRSMDVTDDTFNDSSAVSFVYYNGFSHVESSFHTISQSESDYDSGSGIGSSGGGGFGGGGGGTF